MADDSKSKIKNGIKDIALFGRVISAGLVVAGYTWLGAWGYGWLEAHEYPSWLSFAALPAGAAFGLWQGWELIRRSLKGRKESQD